MGGHSIETRGNRASVKGGSCQRPWLLVARPCCHLLAAKATALPNHCQPCLPGLPLGPAKPSACSPPATLTWRRRAAWRRRSGAGGRNPLACPLVLSTPRWQTTAPTARGGAPSGSGWPSRHRWPPPPSCRRQPAAPLRMRAGRAKGRVRVGGSSRQHRSGHHFSGPVLQREQQAQWRATQVMLHRDCRPAAVERRTEGAHAPARKVPSARMLLRGQPAWKVAATVSPAR